MERERQRERERASTDREQVILSDVRKFRIIEPRHIAPDLRATVDRMLRQKRLFKQVVLDYKNGGRKLEMLMLPSKDGTAPRLQKPKEVYHDLALYPVYQKALAEIEGKGGRVQRVLNDYELKSIKARATNKAAPGRPPNAPLTQREQEVIAAKLNLRVIDGRIYLPDLQVHYLDENDQERVLNLEVTTDTYDRRALAPKVAAGFSMSRADGRAGAAIWDNHRGVLA